MSLRQRLERLELSRGSGVEPLHIVIRSPERGEPGGGPSYGTAADEAAVNEAIRREGLGPIVLWFAGDTAASVLARLRDQAAGRRVELPHDLD